MIKCIMLSMLTTKILMILHLIMTTMGKMIIQTKTVIQNKNDNTIIGNMVQPTMIMMI